MTASTNVKPHIMIVEARFYEDIADHLMAGATAALEEAGATYERFAVPGALEIPGAIVSAVLAMEQNKARRRFDGFVALGCVIRGETSHYDIVAGESARALMALSLDHVLAIGNGILTCENRDQALERARPDQKNKGGFAADAALTMLTVQADIGMTPTY